MAGYPPPGYPHSQHGERSTAEPSTPRGSLLREGDKILRRVPSTELTDLSGSDSTRESEKYTQQGPQRYALPVRGGGRRLAAPAGYPIIQPQPWSPGQNQYDEAQLMPLRTRNGSDSSVQPYLDDVRDSHLSPRPGDTPHGTHLLPLITTSPIGPQVGGYEDVSAGYSPADQSQQFSTPITSTDTTPTRSSSGKGKRRRLSNGESEYIDFNKGAHVNNAQALLSDYPRKLGLQPEGEQILVIWARKHPGHTPNEAELLALSVVTEATEPAINYWLSKRLNPALPVIEAIPSPDPPKPEIRRPAPTNTCKVKRRVAKPWDKPWDWEKPYSCLCRCGWTFTKKGDWIKHAKINQPQESFSCPAPNCRSSFGRKDKLRDHIRNVHFLPSETFDLEARRIPVGNQCDDHCGFCGEHCSSWPNWYDHVGSHFENRIEGGPWTMAHWRYPWVDDETAQGNGSDGGGDDDHDNNDDNDLGNDEDAEYEPDDEYEGPGAQGPPGGYGSGGHFQGPSRSGSGGGGGGGGRSSWQHQSGGNYHTRSSQPPGPFTSTRQMNPSPRTNSMPHPEQHRTKRRLDKIKSEAQRGILHHTTWPLNKDQSPSSPMTTDRTNPLADLVVTGKSQRDAHNAELAPYLEKKAQVLAPSAQTRDDFSGLLAEASNALPNPFVNVYYSLPQIVEHRRRTSASRHGRHSAQEIKVRALREPHDAAENDRRDTFKEHVQGITHLVPQYQLKQTHIDNRPSHEDDISSNHQELHAGVFELPSNASATPLEKSTPHSISLRKGATFNLPPLPPLKDFDPIVSAPPLPQGSPKHPGTLEDSLAARERRTDEVIGNFERNLSEVFESPLDADRLDRDVESDFGSYTTRPKRLFEQPIRARRLDELAQRSSAKGSITPPIQSALSHVCPTLPQVNIFEPTSLVDILATAQLGWKIRKGLTSIQNSPTIIHELKTQIDILTSLLATLGQLMPQTGNWIKESGADILQSCRQTLSSIYLVVTRLQENKKSYADRYRMLEFLNLRNKTATGGTLEGLSSKLQLHVQSVSLSVSILSANHAIAELSPTSCLKGSYDLTYLGSDLSYYSYGELEGPTNLWKHALEIATGLHRIATCIARCEAEEDGRRGYHFDLRPVNILMRQSSDFSLADFGISIPQTGSRAAEAAGTDAIIDSVKSQLQSHGRLFALVMEGDFLEMNRLFRASAVVPDWDSKTSAFQKLRMSDINCLKGLLRHGQRRLDFGLSLLLRAAVQLYARDSRLVKTRLVQRRAKEYTDKVSSSLMTEDDDGSLPMVKTWPTDGHTAKTEVVSDNGNAKLEKHE